jgi:RNA polymerase sigma factor (TIGR02999 family)
MMDDLTRILADVAQGRPEASERLVALLYGELRAMARRELAGERAGHTLQPTALVHEAYLRLAGGDGLRFESRAHFFAAAATAIRRVLVEHARMRARVKRGDGARRVDLSAVDPPQADEGMPAETLMAVDAALARLAGFAPALARVVELRFFAGMTIPETARLLERSETTVQRDWRLARAWLRGELGGEAGDWPGGGERDGP